LTQSEVDDINKIINKGKHSSQTYRAAHILLNCDKGELSKNPKTTNEEICKILKISPRTIDRVKKKFIEGGLEGALERSPTKRIYQKKADGDFEAKLITLCCSEPPAGFSKWSLRLLADTMIELQYVDYISHVTISKVLKKTNLSLGK
jgi:transposase